MSDIAWLIVGAIVLLGIGSGVVLANAMGSLTASQIGTVAANAGFQGQDLITAVAIALAESSGNPNAHGDIGIGQGSFGLWQISSLYHPEFGPDFTKLYDPQTNANAAYSVYLGAGSSFQPWSTFKEGTYQAYLQQASNGVTV